MGVFIKIGQVHADLGLAFHQKTLRLHIIQTAAKEAYGTGDGFGAVHLVGIEIKVVGD